MEEFTENNLRSRLNSLNNHSTSIQSTSAWLLKNHKNREIIIRQWLKTVKKETKVPKVVNLLYVANDVAQNARKTCPQFKDDFFPALESAFRHCLEMKGKELDAVMGKLMTVWKDRQIFTPSQIKRLHELHIQMKMSDSFPSPAGGKNRAQNAPTNQFLDEEAKKNGQDVLLSLRRLQNPPSTEREIRMQLSKYPDNISCPEKLQTVRDSAEAKSLLAQNEEAWPIIEDYVRRLREETKDREQLEQRLNLLIQNVRDSIEHHEMECRNIKRKEDRLKADLLEVEKMFESLPDMTTDMPEMPLPSIQELFGKKQ